MRELEKELEGLPKNFIVGVIMPNDKYEDANMHLLSFLLNRKKASGSYVSVSKPYTHVMSLLKENGINIDNLSFIDCITKSLGSKIPEDHNCVFIDSPEHLTELSVELHKFVTSSDDNRNFVYIDSLSTLGIHNPHEKVMRFIHYLTGKMRLFGFNGMMLSLHEDTDQKLISELGQFCDKVIHL